MKAHASVVAARVGSETAYPVLRSDPPLLLRPTPAGLHLVGGAAGPLGGDRLALDVCVTAGATLRVRSSGATIVLPGCRESAVVLNVHVECGAHLDWRPEPTVSVFGSCHELASTVRLDENATLRWRETVILGRSGEAPGRLKSTLRIERDGRALCHQQLDVGGSDDGWNSAASLGEASVCATEIEVGPPARTAVGRATELCHGAAMALTGDAVLRQVVGPDAIAVERHMRELSGLASQASVETRRSRS